MMFRLQSRSLGFVSLLAVLSLAPMSALAADAPSVEEGKRIYLEKKNKCVTCHGEDGRAQTKMGQKDKVADMTTPEWHAKHSDDAIKAAILKGVDREEGGRRLKMKPMEGATERDAQSLLLFIRTLKSDGKAAPKPEGEKKGPAPEGEKRGPAPDANKREQPKDGAKPPPR
jgi:mono/diheme cytochrome c family protein